MRAGGRVSYWENAKRAFKISEVQGGMLIKVGPQWMHRAEKIPLSMVSFGVEFVHMDHQFVIKTIEIMSPNVDKRCRKYLSTF